MDELLEVVVEAGVEIVGGLPDGPKKGCLWVSVIFVVIAVGVTLYFVL